MAKTQIGNGKYHTNCAVVNVQDLLRPWKKVKQEIVSVYTPFEKELVDIFTIRSDNNPMLNLIIQRAFNCTTTHPDYEKMREYKVFFTSRKTLLNEFNRFEGNMNIFQPAIDISKSALQKEVQDIDNKLAEVRVYMNT